MIVKIFSIKDKKTGAFSPPWQSPTHGSAERAFKTAVNSQENDYAKYPDDFDLYYIADFDDESASYSNNTPVFIISATQLKD